MIADLGGPWGKGGSGRGARLSRVNMADSAMVAGREGLHMTGEGRSLRH